MTLQELYKKVVSSEELKKSFAEAAQDRGKLEAWLKAHGSDATIEQVGDFLVAKLTSDEVSDEELENISGGGTSQAVAFSAFTAGLACFGVAVDSALKGSASECFDAI